MGYGKRHKIDLNDPHHVLVGFLATGILTCIIGIGLSIFDNSNNYYPPVDHVMFEVDGEFRSKEMTMCDSSGNMYVYYLKSTIYMYDNGGNNVKCLVKEG
jgi:hypothetical protein